jgi:glycosyltransferase involved in cell wall biosynthesis
MSRKTSVAIYALHPITYQTPIFEDLHDKLVKEGSGIDVEVLFGDDLSLRNVYYEHLKSSVTFDLDLRLDRFPNKFLKNFPLDARKGFFSRVNPGIVMDIIVNRRHIVLVHGYETFTAWLTIIVCKLFSRKLIFRGEAVLEGTPHHAGFVRKIKHKVLPILFHFIDKFAYSCEGNRRYFQHYGVTSEKLFLMPCAVNNSFFLDLKAKFSNQTEQIRIKYNVPSENFVILFCARFTKRKRPLDLIEAVRSIDNRDITILFVGDGPEREAMAAASKTSGVNAIFTGFLKLNELAELQCVSDVSVNLSSKDPSPKSVNESMLFGLPIIITDVVGTARDLVENDVNGYIIEVGDTKALARHIEFLKLNPGRRVKMGERSLDKIANWNFEVGTRNLINVIKSLEREPRRDKGR